MSSFYKERALIRIQKRNPNVVVLSSTEFSTAFKAVIQPCLYFKKNRYRRRKVLTKWTNSLLAMPFFSHPTVFASLSPLLPSRSSSVSLLRPSAIPGTTYDHVWFIWNIIAGTR